MATQQNAQSNLSAILRGAPPTATAQQKGAMVMPGTGHIRFFKKASVVKAERTWRDMLRPVRDALPAPYEGPVAVGITMTFPHTSGTAKKRLGDTVPLGKRPDIDNLAKALLDTMTQMLFWHDDGQIYQLTLSKWRGPMPNTVITVIPGNSDGDTIRVEV
jgi:Holliday junction resolvase RusA-like endonuclease